MAAPEVLRRPAARGEQRELLVDEVVLLLETEDERGLTRDEEAGWRSTVRTPEQAHGSGGGDVRRARAV